MLTFLLTLAVALDPQSLTKADSDALSVQDARFAAMVKGDGDFLETALDASLTYHHSTGAVQTKAEFIKAIREGGLKYKAIDVVERRVRHFGQVAIITGVMRFQALNNGETIDARGRFTDVYESRAGHLLQVAWQNTRVP